MSCRISGLLLAVFSLSAFLAHAEQRPWTEVTSPHFRVVTDASEHDARTVAAEFEQMRYVFESRFPGFRLEASAPLTILVVRNLDSAKSLYPDLWKRNENIAGFYHQGWEKQFAVVRMNTWGTGAHEVVYHEYVHSIMHLNSNWLPPWMDEGIAEFYAYTHFEPGKIVLGSPTERYRTLREMPLLRVETLITANQGSRYLSDPEKAEVFYADSWALVHYMIFGPGMNSGQRLDQLLGLLQKRIPAEQAFVQVFGDMGKFDQEWANYVKHPGVPISWFPAPAALSDKSFSARKLSVAETELELGAFHYASGDRTAGESLIDAALRDNPQLGAAHEEKAYALFHEGKDSEALKEFTTAYSLDGTLYRSLFARTMLSPESTAIDPAGQAAYRADLEKVTALNPKFAPAFIELAKLAMRERNYQLAFMDSRKAESLEPSRAGYHLLTGRILLASGHAADAAQFASFVAERWYGPDHDEALELWNKIPPAQRPADVHLAAHVLAEHEQFATGIVQSTHCGEAKEPFTIAISTDGKTQTFYRQGNFVWGFADTLWYGEEHVTTCHHFEGKRAVVYYRPGSNNGFAGEVTNFEIRDEDTAPQSLPATSKEELAAAP